jgi:uncharacterized protein
LLVNEAVALLRELGGDEGLIRHSLRVCELALQLAERLEAKGMDLDIALVRIGSLLHDVGRTRSHGVEHGCLGGQIIRRRGLDERVARIAERHVGGGISEDEARELGLPHGEYIPKTLEEKIVCYADKLAVPVERASFEEALEPYIKELGPDHEAVDRLRRLHEEMQGLLSPRGS